MQCNVEMMTSRWIRIPLLERLGLIGPNVFDDKYLLTDRQYRTMQRNHCITFENVWLHTVQCSVHTFSDVVHCYWCACLCAAAFELCPVRRFRSVLCRFRFVSCEKENEEDHLLRSIWKMVYISPMRWGHFCHSYTDSFLDDHGRVSFWDICFVGIVLHCIPYNLDLMCRCLLTILSFWHPIVQEHLKIRYLLAPRWTRTIKTHLDLNWLLKHELMRRVESTIRWSIMNKDSAER